VRGVGLADHDRAGLGTSWCHRDLDGAHGQQGRDRRSRDQPGGRRPGPGRLRFAAAWPVRPVGPHGPVGPVVPAFQRFPPFVLFRSLAEIHNVPGRRRSFTGRSARPGGPS